MTLRDLLKKRTYITLSAEAIKGDKIEGNHEKPIIPDGMWRKCNECGEILYKEDLENNLWVCTKCNYHFRINARTRLNLIVDEDSFKENLIDLRSVDPLKFKGYKEKLSKSESDTGEADAVITGVGKINGIEAAIAVMNSAFMMGSMGTVVGEKITRLIEEATDKKLPLIIFTTSGGARMQEGIFSLMQMAKISGAINLYNKTGLPYITVLTDPTTGGVTASFAMEGDIILSEPGALIGFAGRRVIEGTINQKLPDNFQKAEFLLEKGFIDNIVNRKSMKDTICKLLILHGVNNNE